MPLYAVDIGKVSSWKLVKGQATETGKERGRGRTDVDNEAASFVGSSCAFQTVSWPISHGTCWANAPSGPAKDPTKWSSESPTCSIVTVFCGHVHRVSGSRWYLC